MCLKSRSAQDHGRLVNFVIGRDGVQAAPSDSESPTSAQANAGPQAVLSVSVSPNSELGACFTAMRACVFPLPKVILRCASRQSKDKGLDEGPQNSM
jgi:hypothetical protein